MSPKVRNIIGWVLTALLAALFIWSASMKFIGGGPEMEKGMADMGITMDTLHILGVVEALAIVLFIIPRTGVVGTLLLVAYLGGAIATHLEHQQPIMMPVIISMVLWITAAIRFPELTSRLFGAGKQSL
jgi:uncharacterized membrane protein YphA (DoxX/SURF4 family)